MSKKIIILTALAIVESVWLVIAAWVLLQHTSLHPALADQVLPEWQDLLRPEWETVLYRLLIVSVVLLQGGALWWIGKRWDTWVWPRSWQVFLAVELVWVIVLLIALFKWTIYAQRPQLAQGFFYCFLMMSLLSKIFFVWGYQQRRPIKEFFQGIALIGQGGSTWLGALLIGLIIFIPNPQAVVARMFIGEQFHHNDSFIMGPAWAHLSGARLDVDTISQYGLGFVYVVTFLSKLVGAFSYTGMLQTLVLMTLVYYLLWFYLLRRWMGSSGWALVAVLLGIKWQMFHTASYPLVFTYGSMTPVRFFYDVFYFIFLYRFFESKRRSDLWAAAAVAGFGIFYFTSEGVYATASFYAGLFLLTCIKHLRQEYPLTALQRVIAVFIPPLMFIGCLFLSHGTVIANKLWWRNIGEFIEYFLSGFGLEPIYKTLVERKFLESLMGLMIPCFYLFTLLVFGTLLVLRKISSRHWWVVMVVIYGLGTYHYYIARSVVTSYYTVALPFAFVLIFVAKKAIDLLGAIPLAAFLRRAIFIGIPLSLLTTHQFLSYPNALNFSHDPMTDTRVAIPLMGNKPYFMHLFRDFPQEFKLPFNSFGQKDEGILSERNFASDAQLIEYYHQQMGIIDKDAAMIGQLTNQDEAVAVISSFEVELLMKANRQPFFYYFPLVISRPLTMRIFTATSIYTTDQLARTLAKLETYKPGHIFIEKIFLTQEVPQNYYFQYPALMALLGYVKEHYVPSTEGQFLMAMKRVK